MNGQKCYILVMLIIMVCFAWRMKKHTKSLLFFHIRHVFHCFSIPLASDYHGPSKCISLASLATLLILLNQGELDTVNWKILSLAYMIVTCSWTYKYHHL